MRCWGRCLVAATTAMTGSLLVSAPSGATPSHPGGVADTCPEVVSGHPTGGLEKLTTPPPGTEVPRDAVITVILRWHRTRFATGPLHKVLDCVTVDGEPADGLSLQQRDPANAGEFTLRLTVPDHLADGTRLCDRGFVSGTGVDGSFVREKSNDVCFTVRGDSPSTPAPTDVPPQLILGSAPPDALPPAPTPPAPTTPSTPAPSLFPAPAGPMPADTGAGPAGGGAPGTEVAGIGVVADQPIPTLPRTGVPVIPLTAAGLATTAAGIIARRSARLRCR